MSTDKFDGERIALGWWLYAGVVKKRVEVVAFTFDYWFELPGDDGRELPEPYQLNPEGRLYYIRADGGEPLGFPPFMSIDDARAWADAQPWAPIDWDD